MTAYPSLRGVPRLACMALLPLLGGHALAQSPSISQPGGLNLGVTSFYDGFSGPPGWAWQTTVRHSSANKIVDANGHANPVFADPKINSTVVVNQLSHAMPTSIQGWRPGFMAILPVVSLDSSFGPGPSLKDGGTGLADMTLEASLQSEPVVNAGGAPVFVQRLTAAAILPTGRYKQNLDINQGSGYASFNPYWAATFFPAPRWEMSWRLHYLYNFKNDKPASSAPRPFNGQPVTTTQAGDAAWVNFAASYAVTPDVSLGINGYYFQQLSDSRANGTRIADSRERVLGIGPGLMWRISPEKALWVNAYSESMVRNRASSALNLQVRTVFAF
ncbi:phenol degradation protein meta [Rhodoferax koreense]|uniref:Phenol degradation protein meta n=1 Tax=Rhodoferax koreensis TaxID=1842727 RepID=A0A1P8K0Y9_9BURK|nr:transporter [Rhodoferax koreense]APW39601.1 phenol degradation protein meta [Rhodoferax koreense]